MSARAGVTPRRARPPRAAPRARTPRARTTTLSAERSLEQSVRRQLWRSAIGQPRGARTPSTHVPFVLSSMSSHVEGPAATILRWPQLTARRAGRRARQRYTTARGFRARESAARVRAPPRPGARLAAAGCTARAWGSWCARRRRCGAGRACSASRAAAHTPPRPPAPARPRCRAAAAAPARAPPRGGATASGLTWAGRRRERTRLAHAKRRIAARRRTADRRRPTWPRVTSEAAPAPSWFASACLFRSSPARARREAPFRRARACTQRGCAA